MLNEIKKFLAILKNSQGRALTNYQRQIIPFIRSCILKGPFSIRLDFVLGWHDASNS